MLIQKQPGGRFAMQTSDRPYPGVEYYTRAELEAVFEALVFTDRDGKRIDGAYRYGTFGAKGEALTAYPDGAIGIDEVGEPDDPGEVTVETVEVER